MEESLSNVIHSFCKLFCAWENWIMFYQPWNFPAKESQVQILRRPCSQPIITNIDRAPTTIITIELIPTTIDMIGLTYFIVLFKQYEENKFSFSILFWVLSSGHLVELYTWFVMVVRLFVFVVHKVLTFITDRRSAGFVMSLSLTPRALAAFDFSSSVIKFKLLIRIIFRIFKQINE